MLCDVILNNAYLWEVVEILERTDARGIVNTLKIRYSREEPNSYLCTGMFGRHDKNGRDLPGL